MLNNNKIFHILRDIIGIILILSISYIVLNFHWLHLMITSWFEQNQENTTIIEDNNTDDNENNSSSNDTFVLYNNSKEAKRNKENNIYLGKDTIDNTKELISQLVVVDKDINKEIEDKLKTKRDNIIDKENKDKENNKNEKATNGNNEKNNVDFFELSFPMNNEEKELYWNDSYIVIPKISVSAPIFYPDVDTDNLENHILWLLEDGVVHRPETQLPHQSWNFFILWHSSNYSWIQSEYNNIFAKLDFLDLWDQVFVYYEWRKYIYELSEKKIVDPNAIEVYWYIPGHNLSIMTCWPIWSVKQRMIWIFSLKRNI